MEKKSKGKLLWELFTTFFKIGLFTFGGGYAMIPLIQQDVVENKKWIDSEEMLDMIAIAESTPGVLAVNSATFVGCEVGGVLGSAVATIGVVLPSFIIISIISLFFLQFKELKWVNYAFLGIRSGVVLLIVNAVIKLSKQFEKNAFTIIVSIAAFLCAAVLNFDIMWILVACAVAGLLYQILVVRKRGQGEK